VKKALAIIFVVAVYSWVEALFLLSILAPGRDGSHPVGRQAFVAGAQLLVIPSTAALFSRLIYGAKGWPVRAIKIVLAGALALPLFLTAFGIVGAAIAWAASVNVILFTVFFVVLGGGFTFGTIWVAVRISRRSIPIEAERWLKERQLKSIDRKRRSRGIRVALWIPGLTVLLAGTFLLPIWGVLSHVVHPNAGDFGQFRVPLPLTSIVMFSHRDAKTGDVWADFMSGHGSPLLGLFFPSKRLRLSDWNFRINPSSDPGNKSPRTYDGLTGRRQFVIGHENIECLEYTPSYLRERSLADYSTTMSVECGGPGRFSATSYGEKADLPEFYQALAGTKELK